MTSLSGKRAATVGLLLLVFGAGTIFGVVLGHRGVGEGGVLEAGEVRNEEDRSPRRGIVHELVLTEDQRAQVDSILEHHRTMWSELQQEVAPRHREIMATTRSAIRDVLTEAQEQQYDSLLAEAREAREARRQRDDQRDTPSDPP